MIRLNIIRKLISKPVMRSSRTCCTFEPDYLKTNTSADVGTYDTLNVQIRGYDYPVLESFQSFIHKTAENMGFEVEDSWATPAQKLLIKKLKMNSTAVETEYNLTFYERNVQVVDVPSNLGAIFFDAVHEALPEGVELSIHEHLEEHEEIRYVPDLELIQLKTELETLRGPSKKKN